MATDERYPVPSEKCRVEEVIKRSRFITSVGYTETEQDARLFVDEIRREFPDSSHNCWAYLIGTPGDSRMVGMSDDGEPHGTAGRPILTVLLHCGIGDLTAVVTRYFGGTKLGKGGLVRAYSGGIKNALEKLVLVEKIKYETLRVVVKYSQVTMLQRLLPTYEAQTISEAYGADATYEIKVPEIQAEPLRQALRDLTNGDVQITAVDSTV